MARRTLCRTGALTLEICRTARCLLFWSAIFCALLLAIWSANGAAASEGRAAQKPGRTLVLVTDAACESKLPDLLNQWEADRRVEGWKVLKRIITGPDAVALQARLREIKPDHTFLLGDGVPFLTVAADPDGHGARNINSDYRFVKDESLEPYGAVGRVWFKNQTMGAKTTSIELYRRYLKKRHTWEADRVRFGPMTAFDDHLNYRPDGKIWEKAVMGQMAPDRIEHLNLGAVDSDGEIKRRAKSPRLFEVVFSGGLVSGQGVSLFYFGDAAAWRNADPENWGAGPKIGIFGAYGSFLCHTELGDSLLMTAITTQYTIASFYDYQGVFPFGKMQSGRTIGDCGRACAQDEFYITNVLGDPTVTTVNTAHRPP